MTGWNGSVAIIVPQTAWAAGLGHKQSVVVWQFGGITSDEIWFWVRNESDSGYLIYTLPNSSANAVHSVHYSPVSVENNRVVKINFVDQLHVLQ
jgi:hypothetical protein